MKKVFLVRVLCPFVCLPACLSVCLIFLFVCVSLSVSVSLCVYCLSVCVLLVCLSLSQSVSVSVSLSVCLSLPTPPLSKPSFLLRYRGGGKGKIKLTFSLMQLPVFQLPFCSGSSIPPPPHTHTHLLYIYILKTLKTVAKAGSALHHGATIKDKQEPSLHCTSTLLIVFLRRYATDFPHLRLIVEEWCRWAET